MDRSCTLVLFVKNTFITANGHFGHEANVLRITVWPNSSELFTADH